MLIGGKAMSTLDAEDAVSAAGGAEVPPSGEGLHGFLVQHADGYNADADTVDADAWAEADVGMAGTSRSGARSGSRTWTGDLSMSSNRVQVRSCARSFQPCLVQISV